MSEIILDIEKIDIINQYFIKSEEKKFNGLFKTLLTNITLDDLKSFQSAPNGMKWSAEEKESF